MFLLFKYFDEILHLVFLIQEIPQIPSCSRNCDQRPPVGLDYIALGFWSQYVVRVTIETHQRFSPAEGLALRRALFKLLIAFVDQVTAAVALLVSEAHLVRVSFSVSGAAPALYAS